MAELLQGFVEVLTAANLITAILGGLAAGFFLVGRAAAEATYVSPNANSRSVGVLVALYTLAVGAIFYIGQAAAGIAQGDDGWTRLAARFGLWVVFCIALGHGTALRVDWYLKRRKRQVLDEARRTLDE